MLNAVRIWLVTLFQAIKVWSFRVYYRVSNARAWRGKTGQWPCTDLRIPVTGTTIGARLYSNALGTAKPLIVYIHGGGWVIGDLQTHNPFCQALSSATGCSVIALDYRLAPEHRFPTAQEDCLAATSWVAEHVAELGSNNHRLVIAGDSAGGNLATCSCLEIDAASREKIIGQVLICPATDHYSAGFASYVEKATGQTLTTNIVQWFWDTYLGGMPPRALEAQRGFPLRSGELASLPPTLLVTAEKDPLLDEGKSYAEKIQAEGVPVSYHHFPDAAHGFACSEGPHADFLEFIKQLNLWLAQRDGTEVRNDKHETKT